LTHLNRIPLRRLADKAQVSPMDAGVSSRGSSHQLSWSKIDTCCAFGIGAVQALGQRSDHE
jgi:hypothetical protein